MKIYLTVGRVDAERRQFFDLVDYSTASGGLRVDLGEHFVHEVADLEANRREGRRGVAYAVTAASTIALTLA